MSMIDLNGSSKRRLVDLSYESTWSSPDTFPDLCKKRCIGSFEQSTPQRHACPGFGQFADAETIDYYPLQRNETCDSAATDFSGDSYDCDSNLPNVDLSDDHILAHRIAQSIYDVCQNIDPRLASSVNYFDNIREIVLGIMACGGADVSELSTRSPVYISEEQNVTSLPSTTHKPCNFYCLRPQSQQPPIDRLHPSHVLAPVQHEYNCPGDDIWHVNDEDADDADLLLDSHMVTSLGVDDLVDDFEWPLSEDY